MNDEERGKKKRRMSGLAGILVDAPLSLLPRLLITALILFTNVTCAEEILLTVNVKKPLALTSDKFLSYTLDPTIVLTGNTLTKNPERSVNMAKALSPAYVRIGGPRSNSYTFQRSHRLQNEEDPAFTITEANWIDVHRWAENAGLDIVACIAPQHSESGGRDPGWDSRNALDLISFSDHMGFNTSWQLGYECQTRCDITGSDIGRDVLRLRSMLNAFPRYSKSIVTGPDVVTYRTKLQQQYLQDYLNLAGNALSAITWHPDFSGVILDAYGVSMHHDTLAMERDGLYRVVGRLIAKKPLWLAEAKPEACKKQFLGALVWTRRLGNAARLGAQVIMRQPSDSDLFKPTPDYWVSVLHKALVGREVLDAKITTGNRTHVHFYCQCTRPSSKYEKGSLTIFGINLTPAKIMINLKGLKIKNIHKYILLPGYDAENRMFSETVLLNNEPLNLIYNELPEIRPAISTNSKGVALKLPSGGIGFWVLPGLKIKICGGLEDDNTDKMLLRKLTKRLGEPESAEYSVHGDEATEDKDYDIMSTEERRYSSKMSKPKRQRKYNWSEEDEAARGYKKFEARMDLERLERLLRRRDSYDDRKSRGRTGYFGFDEKSLEKLNVNEDEDVEEETGEEIRAKLDQYKKRLREYESRSKKADLRSREKIIETTESETIDSDTVIEAMQLISKMENAMKSVEKSVDDADPIESLNQDGVTETSELAGPSKNINPEDAFLDELLKSEKIKRTSVPSKIEDQLRAIYQMLAEEKERRQRNIAEAAVTPEAQQNGVEPTPTTEINSSRRRRDTGDKKFGDDSLGLRKGGLFRKRGRNDEMRERRIERRNRRKEKDGQVNPKSVNDSGENNFYGFYQREPLKDFPDGDVFVECANEEVNKASSNYDYVKDDDSGDEAEKLMKLRHVPTEFYQNTKMVVPRSGRFNNANNDEAATYERIVQQENPEIQKDRRVKESTIKKLIGYYDNSRAHQEETTDYADNQRLKNTKNGEKTSEKRESTNLQMDQDVYRDINSGVARKHVKDLTSDDNGGFTGFNSMNFSRIAADSTEDKQALDIYEVDYQQTPRSTARRIRRSSGDLEDILDREMIFEDDNNLKDCECRVVRGTKAQKTLTDLKLGVHRRSSRRSEKPDCRRRIEEWSERRKHRKREGPTTVKPNGRFPATRAKRQVKSTNEHEIEDFIEIEPEFIDGEPPLTVEVENVAKEDTQYVNIDVELPAKDGKAAKDLGSEEVIDVSIDDEDENCGFRNLGKRHNDETTASLQDYQEATIGSEIVDEAQTEVTKSPVKREDNIDKEGLEVTETSVQKADNVDKKEPQVTEFSVEKVDNVGKEEAGVEKSPVKRADNVMNDELEVTESPVKMVDKVANEKPEMTESPIQRIDNVDKEEPEATKSPVKREDNIAEEELEVTNPPVEMVDNIANEESGVTKSLVDGVDNVSKEIPEAPKSPVKRENNVGKEELKVTNAPVEKVDKFANEEPKVTESLVDGVENVGKEKPEVTNTPVKLEDIVTNEEPGGPKSPTKRAYTVSKEVPKMTESPVELVKNVGSTTLKGLPKSSGVKLEEMKNRKDPFFRGNKNNKGKSKRNNEAAKIGKTNNSATKLLETMESTKTEPSETDTRIVDSHSIEAVSSMVIEPRSIEPESRIVEPLATRTETRIVEPRSIDAETSIAHSRSIEAESTIVEPDSVGAETRIVETRPIATESKIVEAHSIDAETKIVELRPSEMIAKTEDSSTTVPVGVTEETSGKIVQDNGHDKGNSTKAQVENEDGGDEIKLKRENVEPKLNSTTNESPTTSTDDVKVFKPSKSIKVDSKTPKRSPPNTKHIEKLADTAKAREARLSARSEALLALKRESDEKKAKKTPESTSRMLAVEHAVNAQKRRAEQLEKLREKLRQKRAKVVKPSRDEFTDELEDTSSARGERNLRRREIIDMIKKDEEISDIVDREKLDYLKRNKPINYEAIKENFNIKESDEKRKKYIPETIEIVRPLHVTRERRVYPLKRTIKATNDPQLIAYEVPDEINFEAMKKNLQEDDVHTNHRIERRDGKSYYSFVESLENPRIYDHLHDVQSGEETSIEMADSAQQNGEEMDNYDDDSDEIEHHRDYRRRHRISDSNEEIVQRLSNSDSSTRSMRNTSNNKYMCLKENPEESSSDNNDELFKLVKENDHYMAMPVQNAKIDDKEKYTAKKKSMKISDYDLPQKYNSSKYARLAVNKTTFVDGDKIMKKNTEDRERSKIQEKEETLQEIAWKKMKKRTRPSNDEIESWLFERNKENSKGRNFPANDGIDLDEALNSSAYELLMLIPINKNQKRSRQKRHVGNEIQRDQEDSALNGIPIEMTMKKNETSKMTKDKNEDTTINEMKKFIMDGNEDMTINEISSTEDSKIDESGPFTRPEIINKDVNEINDNEKGKDGMTLDGYENEKIVPSAPKIVSNDPKKSVEDDGLTSLLEMALPRLEASVTTGLGKARRVSENLEKYINDFDDGFEQEELKLENEGEKSTKPEETVENNFPISSNIFGSTFTNVKKFFDFLTGIAHIFRIN